MLRVRLGRPAQTGVEEGTFNVDVVDRPTVGLGAELAVGRGVKLGVTVPEGVGERMSTVGEAEAETRIGFMVIRGGSEPASGK